MVSADANQVASLLAARRGVFLAFLRKRVSSATEAEDLLQTAMARGLEKAHAIKDQERVVAWFYRLLRNALVDRHRQQVAATRAQTRLAHEPLDAEDPELHQSVCQCIAALVPLLKPEYATVLQRVELEESGLAEVASELGITPNNAGVRLHRARAALLKQVERTCGDCATHGCTDCSCGDKRRPAIEAQG